MAEFEAEISKSFLLEAAHQLPHVPPGHRCGRLHGHNFRITIRVKGPVNPHTGFVVDYAQIEEGFAPIFQQLDHRFLNEIEGLENPTSELMAAWVLTRISISGARVTSVTVEENPDSSSTVYASN